LGTILEAGDLDSALRESQLAPSCIGTALEGRGCCLSPQWRPVLMVALLDAPHGLKSSCRWRRPAGDVQACRVGAQRCENVAHLVLWRLHQLTPLGERRNLACPKAALLGSAAPSTIYQSTALLFTCVYPLSQDPGPLQPAIRASRPQLAPSHPQTRHVTRRPPAAPSPEGGPGDLPVPRLPGRHGHHVLHGFHH
jgi:hypothetical protein